MSIYIGKNNSFGVDVIVGDFSYSNALFGLIELEVVGDVSLIIIFGFNVFESIGEASSLFGVSWL